MTKCYPVGEIGDIILIENIVLDEGLDPNDDTLPDITKILLRVDKDFLYARYAKITDKCLRDGNHVYIAKCTIQFKVVLLDGEFKILEDIS